MLRGAWHGVILGTPAALLLTFLARLFAGNDFPFAVTFWIALAIAVGAGAWGMKRNARGERLTASPIA